MKSNKVGQCSIEFPRPKSNIAADLAVSITIGGLLGYALFIWVTL